MSPDPALRRRRKSALGKSQGKDARDRETLRKGLLEATDGTGKQLQNQIEKVRKGIRNKTALSEPVSAIADEHRLTRRVPALEGVEAYVWPGLIVVLAALLVKAGVALRPRYQAEVERAVRKAEDAEEAARRARTEAEGASATAVSTMSTVEAVKAAMPKPRKRKPKAPPQPEAQGS